MVGALKEGATREEVEDSLALAVAVRDHVQRMKSSLAFSVFTFEGKAIGISDLRKIAKMIGVEVVEYEWENSVATDELCRRLEIEYYGTTFCGYEYKRKDVEND